jgi:glutathione S-transferase
MSSTPLTLHYHPLSSFCWKVLIALYENDTPFTPNVVDLGDAAQRAALLKLWPIGKFPVLEDGARDRIVPESSIIIEYLAQHYPGSVTLIPTDPDRARQTRLRDRFYDHYVHLPMQKIVADRIRPDGQKDPTGVAAAMAQIETAYAMIENDLGDKPWAMGDAFTMADCAAAPALYYANVAVSIGTMRPHTVAYLQRLMARLSFARVLTEAEPYFRYFPLNAERRERIASLR